MIIDQALFEAIGALSTAASVLLVGALGLRQIKQAEEQKTRENTINILLHLELEDAAYVDLLAGDARSPDGSSTNYIIARRLNQLEFLCAVLRKNILDEELVLEDSAFRIYRAYKKFKPYIDGTRKRLNAPKAFEHIEWVVREKISPAWGLKIDDDNAGGG
jgi:hypothetical protein